MPSCTYHAAAVFGRADGSESPDTRTRALFEHVYEHFDDADDDQED